MRTYGLQLFPRPSAYGAYLALDRTKGIDLVATVLDEMLQADIQLVVLGKGDWKYETILKNAEKTYNTKMRAIINFSQELASKLYGAADMFLMPSKFEPCGLGQMIAMRYGAVPIVRETGGLKDTVEAFNPVTQRATASLSRRIRHTICLTRYGVLSALI